MVLKAKRKAVIIQVVSTLALFFCCYYFKEDILLE